MFYHPHQTFVYQRFNQNWWKKYIYSYKKIDEPYRDITIINPYNSNIRLFDTFGFI